MTDKTEFDFEEADPSFNDRPGYLIARFRNTCRKTHTRGPHFFKQLMVENAEILRFDSHDSLRAETPWISILEGTNQWPEDHQKIGAIDINDLRVTLCLPALAFAELWTTNHLLAGSERWLEIEFRDEGARDHHHRRSNLC